MKKTGVMTSLMKNNKKTALFFNPYDGIADDWNFHTIGQSGNHFSRNNSLNNRCMAATKTGMENIADKACGTDNDFFGFRRDAGKMYPGWITCENSHWIFYLCDWADGITHLLCSVIFRVYSADSNVNQILDLPGIRNAYGFSRRCHSEGIAASPLSGKECLPSGQYLSKARYPLIHKANSGRSPCQRHSRIFSLQSYDSTAAARCFCRNERSKFTA